MLVLSRKVEQAIWLDEQIKVIILDIKGNVVRLGIDAPKSVSVDREEVMIDKRDKRIKRDLGRY